MITSIKMANQTGDVFLEYSVKTGQNETAIHMLEYEPPYAVWGEDPEDNEYGIIGYEGGSALAVITVVGEDTPTSREFSDAFHKFLKENNIEWTSKLEQDMLWEVFGATKI